MVELPESSVTFDLNVDLENHFRGLRTVYPCWNLGFMGFKETQCPFRLHSALSWATTWMCHSDALLKIIHWMSSCNPSSMAHGDLYCSAFSYRPKCLCPRLSEQMNQWFSRLSIWQSHLKGSKDGPFPDPNSYALNWSCVIRRQAKFFFLQSSKDNFAIRTHCSKYGDYFPSGQHFTSRTWRKGTRCLDT